MSPIKQSYNYVYLHAQPWMDASYYQKGTERCFANNTSYLSLCVNTTCQSPHHICASLKRYGHSLCQQCPKNYALYINTLSGLSLSNCCLKCSNQTVSNKHGGNTVRKWVVSRRYALIAELKGEASNCDALSFRVGMYVYPQLAQCNSMLVYVYLQRLRNTILCSRMYICHACTTIVRFSCQNVPLGTITAPDYCLACVARILSMEEHNHKLSSPCPAHYSLWASKTGGCASVYSWCTWSPAQARLLHFNVCPSIK